jgi:hypothetical protein
MIIEASPVVLAIAQHWPISVYSVPPTRSGAPTPGVRTAGHAEEPSGDMPERELNNPSQSPKKTNGHFP